MARIYSDVNQNRPSSYWDYENHVITWSDQNDYQLVKKIGRGKYSEVFEGIDIVSNTSCVIKVLKPVKESKILREIKILQNLRDVVNVIQLIAVVRDEITNIPSLVFEHIDCISWLKLQSSLTDLEARYYMYQLLIGLDACHSMGIMHRDVKPHNIIVNHSQRVLRLIDWGLAEFYHKNKHYNVRVASRHYKAPELLVGYEQYDYSLDLWSYGCVLASVAFHIDTLFLGQDNTDQLVKIAKQLGKDDLKTYIGQYCSPSRQQTILGWLPDWCPSKRCIKACLTDRHRQSSNGQASKSSRHHHHHQSTSTTSSGSTGLTGRASTEALDLVDKLLRYNHVSRLTASEAMQHKYFAPIRPENVPLRKSRSAATSATAATATNNNHVNS